MASKAILLLGIILLVATKVSSYDEDLKNEVNYAKSLVPTAAPPVVTVPTPPPVKAPPPPLVTVPHYPPVKAQPPPPPVKAPTTPPPPVEAPTTPPPVKAPTTPPPPVKAPTTPPPPVKAPTPPAPPVKLPPPQPPVVKPPVIPAPPAPIVKSKKDCIPLCGYRCQLHSRKGLCTRACITCCDRCKCVPPGTYGNREKCGKCYTDMLTHGNRYKCP